MLDVPFESRRMPICADTHQRHGISAVVKAIREIEIGVRKGKLDVGDNTPASVSAGHRRYHSCILVVVAARSQDSKMIAAA